MNSRKIIIFLALVMIGLFGLYTYKKYRVAPTIDLLKQEVFDEHDQKTDLSSYKGKKLIITYYASWCVDCLKEMKVLNEIKETDLNDVTVVAITDESLEKLISFKTKKQYPFIFLRLNKAFDKINIYTIPVTYIVNTKGELVYEKVGAINWKDASFLAHIKTLF